MAEMKYVKKNLPPVLDERNVHREALEGHKTAVAQRKFVRPREEKVQTKFIAQIDLLLALANRLEVDWHGTLGLATY
ncbi:hypothetical protein EJ02DRAFT_459679 [Clathrospora elynae]|uniref:Uncharacterized protein n=1 Tax=Clathrospora elynae TaxID=706981 RepID=A0A6A5S9F4_9PLEO|nr:hypothetical protein EJ02DRAFT_459679 [Clathrospora elynae]